MKLNKKIFLGGTCANSNWRDILIPMLSIDYFNPVVENWTLEDQKEEIRQRSICDYCLYTITSEMMGVYSIAEVVDDSNKQPEKTIFCLLKEGFSSSQLKSLEQVGKMVVQNGGEYFTSLEQVAKYVNYIKKVI